MFADNSKTNTGITLCVIRAVDKMDPAAAADALQKTKHVQDIQQQPFEKPLSSSLRDLLCQRPRQNLKLSAPRSRNYVDPNLAYMPNSAGEGGNTATSSHRLHLAAAANDVAAIRSLLLNSSTTTSIDAVEESSGQTALHVACSRGNVEAVQCLIDSGCDVNAQDSFGDTALHIALAKQHLEIETCLILCLRTEKNKANRAGQTPFHKAVLAPSQKETISNLLNAAFDPQAKDNDGLSPFHLCVVNDFLQQAEAFVEYNKMSVGQMTESGETPLHLAFRHGNTEMIRLLVEADANLDSTHRKFGTSALWLAADLQNDEAAELIVNSNNFKLTSVFDFGQEDSSPFLVALARENRKIKRMLFENAGLKLRILFGDFDDDDDEYLDEIEKEFKDELGNTVLHLAVLSDSIITVKKIYPLCQDDSVRNDQGKTALDLAGERGRSEIVDFLQADRDSGITEGLRQISDLSDRFPAFQEFEEPWFKLEPNGFNDISIEDLERYIVAPIAIDWRKSGPRKLLEQGWDTQKGDNNDNNETRLIKDVIKIMCDVESHLNDNHKVFRHLGVEFLPAGSVVEGTRIGLLNEMDFMVNFSELSGHLVIRDETSLVTRTRRDVDAFHPDVQKLFDSEGRLDVRGFFLAFIEAVGEAVGQLENIPEGVKIGRSYKSCEECSNKEFVRPIRKQCVHQLASPPAVCFTKVGAGLNFIVNNSIFTVDLVLSFEGMLKFHSGTTELRRSLVEHLLEENPPGWRDFLLKFIIGERASLEQFEQSRGEITVGVKMVDYNGNFVLRPGLALEVPETFSSESMRKAYCILKLLKFLSDGEIKSYDLKKVMYQLKKKKEINVADCYKIVSMVLEHKDVIGKLHGIWGNFRNSFDGIDLNDFPKEIEGKKYLHFLHKSIGNIWRAVANSDVPEIRKLLLEVSFSDEAYSDGGSYPLHWACAPTVRPSAEVIEVLIRNGCSIGRKNFRLNDDTPLHMLMCNEFASASSLRALLAAAEDTRFLRQENRKGLRPLQLGIVSLSESDAHCNLLETLVKALSGTSGTKEAEELLMQACTLGKFRFASLLLAADKGLDAAAATAVDKHGQTPMDFAAGKGDVTLINLLPKELVNARDNGGQTPLMKASYWGHLEAMEALLARGAAVNDKDRNGYSALLYAVQSDVASVAVLKRLLDLGADPSDTGVDGTTLLGLVAREGNVESFRLVMSLGGIVDQADAAGQTPLMLASDRGHDVIVRELLRRGASVAKTKVDGCTALHLACFKGRDDVAGTLIVSGADVNQGASGHANGGVTPLWAACFGGHLSTVRLLFEAGADVTKGDRNNTRPLEIACGKGHDDIARYLIETGRCDANKADDLGSTALDRAVAQGHLSTIRLLCETGGVHLEAVDQKNGLSRLQRACAFDQVGTATVLIQAGSDVNRSDAKGVTPLIRASLAGHLSIVKMLLDAGAIPGTRCAAGYTAFDYLCMQACRSQTTDCATTSVTTHVTTDDMPASFKASSHLAC